MGDTKIDYLDKQISVIVGCSYGCHYCWARNRVAPRMAHRCKLCGQFRPHFHRERLNKFALTVKPKIIGVNFMGDTWDPQIKSADRMDLFRVMYSLEGKNNQYIILTKQPQNIKREEKDSCDQYRYVPYGKNLWVGVSIDNIHDMTRWVAFSQKEYIHNKIISFEPVLNFNSIFTPVNSLEHIFKVYGTPKWIIVGALTKSDKVSMDLSKIEVRFLIERLKKLPNCPPIFVKSNVGMNGSPKEYPKEM